MLHTEKPTYALEDGRLALENHPVPEDRYRPLQRWLLDHSLVYGLILDRQLRASARDKKPEVARVDSGGPSNFRNSSSGSGSFPCGSMEMSTDHRMSPSKRAAVGNGACGSNS